MSTTTAPSSCFCAPGSYW